MTAQEKKALERYEELKRNIRRTTTVLVDETPEQKQKRINRLLNNPVEFCRYYFPIFFDPKEGGAEPAWFHKKGLKDIAADKDYYGVWEWPREHAKSVVADIFTPLFLKAKGEVTGVVICSAKADNAKGLLSDLQAQLEENQRYISDFGEQKNHGDWASEHFITLDGVGFWAIGKGQSPRGIREGHRRPNLLIIDDFDDDEEVKNPTRILASLNWLRGAMMGAMSINQRRILMVGNRIAKKSVLAHIVGDVKEGDQINKAIKHIKVYALENPKTHAKDESETGVPAWKERYTRDRLVNVIFVQYGYYMTQREMFHNAIEEGTVFKNEWFKFVSVPKDWKNYAVIVTYNDPSFKDTKKNDYKAVVMIGKIKIDGIWRYHLLDCWVRQATRTEMAKAHFDMGDKLNRRNAKHFYHFIEANFIQSLIMGDYLTEAQQRGGKMLGIQEDKRNKPDKAGRIEGLTSYFMYDLFHVSDELKGSEDFENLKAQFLSFPMGHDDAPDAVEGGIFIANQKGEQAQDAIATGGFTRTSNNMSSGRGRMSR